MEKFWIFSVFEVAYASQKLVFARQFFVSPTSVAKFFALLIFVVFLGTLANRLVNCLSNVKGKAIERNMNLLV